MKPTLITAYIQTSLDNGEIFTLSGIGEIKLELKRIQGYFFTPKQWEQMEKQIASDAFDAGRMWESDVNESISKESYLKTI